MKFRKKFIAKVISVILVVSLIQFPVTYVQAEELDQMIEDVTDIAENVDNEVEVPEEEADIEHTDLEPSDLLGDVSDDSEDDTSENTETEENEEKSIEDAENSVEESEKNDDPDIENDTDLVNEDRENVNGDVEIKYNSSSKFSDTVVEKTSSNLIGNLNNYLHSGQKMPYGMRSKNVTGTTASMPATGDIKTLVLSVEFKDSPFEDDIKTKIKNVLWGEQDENSALYPRESAKAFYQRSSFGKLNLVEGDVFTYTSSHERSYYDDDLDALIYELIDDFKNQLLENYDGEDAVQYVNDYLKQFDSDGDGVIDGVYIYYTGGHTAWGEQWWSYVGYYNGFEIGDYSFGSTCILGELEPVTVIHETGHMLGLGDYYNYEHQGFGAMVDISSIDMMAQNTGDQNAFSKMLLGWIEPEQIEIITEGSQEVKLDEVQKNGKSLIIIPDYEEDRGLYTEFFLITYRKFISNDTLKAYNFDVEGGVCIYHVNATLNEAGDGFLYDLATAATVGRIPLIVQLHADGNKTHLLYNAESMADRTEVVICAWGEGENTEYNCFFHAGDEFTPYTIPSTSTYASSISADGTKYSGIFVKDIVIDNGIAGMTAGFEDDVQDYEVTYGVETADRLTDKINQFQLDLHFSTNVYPVEKGDEWAFDYTLKNVAEIIDENGEKAGDANLSLSKSQYGLVKVQLTDSAKANMEYDKEYTIIIPENTIKDHMGKGIAEIRESYSTGMGDGISEIWNASEVFGYVYKNCIDENGNGIVAAYPYWISAKDGHVSIYQYEKFNLIKKTETNIWKECFSDLEYTDSELEEAEHIKVDVWNAAENKWGIAIYTDDKKGWMSFIDHDGNIIEKSVIPAKQEDVPRIYGEDGYKDYDHALVYDEYSLYPSLVAGHDDKFLFADGLVGMNASLEGGGIGAYLFDLEGKCVYYNSLGELWDLKKYDHNYYVIEESNSGNYPCEFCGAKPNERQYHLLVFDEKHQLIKRYHYNNQPIHRIIKYNEGFILESTNADNSVLLCDNNFALIDKLNEHMGNCICYIDGYVCTSLQLSNGNFVGYKTYLPYDGNESIDCIVNYDLGGNDVAIESVSVKKGTKIDGSVKPTKESYTFIGWFKDAECTEPWDFETDIVQSDITLYAGWKYGEEKTYQITFTIWMQDGVISEAYADVKENRKIEEPEAPVMEGWRFTGWFKDVECTEPWDFDADIVQSDIILYAGWKKEQSGEDKVYTVIFDTLKDGIKVESYTDVKENSKIEEPPTPITEGWRFTGWFKDIECTEPWDFDTDIVQSDIILYAGWEKSSISEEDKNYNVIFDTLKDGVESEIYVGVKTGSKIEEPAIPVAEGYRFIGWFKDVECTEPWDFDTDIVQSDITLYAGWALDKGLGDVLPEDIPVSGNIPDGIWVAGITTQSYTGKAITQSFRVYDGNRLLKNKVDYTAIFKNNTKAYVISDTKNPSTEDKKKAPQVNIKMKGNYGGSQTVYFNIAALDIGSIDNFSVPEMTTLYNNKKNTPTPQLTWNDKNLKMGTDFYVKEYKEESENTNAFKGAADRNTTYTLTLLGTGNFSGERSTTLTIAGKTTSSGITQILMSKVSAAKIPNQQYTGNDIMISSLKDKSGNGFKLTLSYKKKRLTENVDYKVFKIVNNKEIGTAAVTLRGLNAVASESGYSFVGDKVVTFKITGSSISKAKVSGLNKSYLYTGTAIEPEVELAGISENDYRVEYLNNINAGTATIIFTGVNACSGTKKATFKISGYPMNGNSIRINNGSDKSIAATYLKGGAKPKVTVNYENRTLLEGTDYTLKYTNNKQIADVSSSKAPAITIIGKGNFTGKKNVPFTINAADITHGITMIAGDVTVNAKANKYQTKITLWDADGTVLKAGADYDKNSIKYFVTENGIERQLTKQDKPEAGTIITVKVNGKGNYGTGEIHAEYRVLKENTDISKGVFRINDQPYTGTEITITDQKQFKVNAMGDFQTYLKSGKTYNYLTLGKDFVIVDGSYKKNINKGKASVMIHGVGNYGGYKTVTFNIGSRSVGDIWKWTSNK